MASLITISIDPQIAPHKEVMPDLKSLLYYFLRTELIFRQNHQRFL